MADGGNLMAGKRGIVFGVANNRSIAWGITKTITDQGAELAALQRVARVVVRGRDAEPVRRR